MLLNNPVYYFASEKRKQDEQGSYMQISVFRPKYQKYFELESPENATGTTI